MSWSGDSQRVVRRDLEVGRRSERVTCDRRTTLVEEAGDSTTNLRTAELRRVGDRLSVDCLRVARRPYEWEQSRPTRQFTVGIALDDRVHRVEQDVGDGWMSIRTRGAGSFYVGPALDSWRSVARDPSEALFVAAPIDSLASLLGTDTAGLGEALRPLHDGFRTDALVRNMGLEIWRASATVDASADLFVEGALGALVARATALARGRPWSTSPLPVDPLGVMPGRLDGRDDPTGLDDRRLARVLDYLEAHLDRPLSVAALASKVGLGPSHFARAFKRAVGEPVWRFVLDRRLERARSLLEGTSRSLADIAFDCGFSSQSHFGRAFVRRYGTTPSRYRRETGRP